MKVYAGDLCADDLGRNIRFIGEDGKRYYGVLVTVKHSLSLKDTRRVTVYTKPKSGDPTGRTYTRKIPADTDVYVSDVLVGVTS